MGEEALMNSSFNGGAAGRYDQPVVPTKNGPPSYVNKKEVKEEVKQSNVYQNL
jgi:hypothetical protein